MSHAGKGINVRLMRAGKSLKKRGRGALDTRDKGGGRVTHQEDCPGEEEEQEYKH